MSFLQLTGHMHRRGKHYEAISRTAAGEMKSIYTTDTWDDPPTKDFSPALSLKVGDFIDYSCSYDNETATTLTHGESAATNEMCNLFGVFFPAPGGNGIYGRVLGN